MLQNQSLFQKYPRMLEMSQKVLISNGPKSYT